jgi:hypothetical protein
MTRWALILLAVTAVALLAVGCAPEDKAQSDILQAINSLDHAQGEAASIIHELEEKLEKEHKAIAVEVAALVETAEAQAETHYKCSLEFTNHRLAEDLENIRIVHFLQKTPVSQAPRLCGSRPEGLSVDDADTGLYSAPGLVVYGFNFPSESTPAVTILSGNPAHPAETHVPEAYIDRQGSFDVDVNITALASAKQIPSDSYKLLLEYPNAPRWEVAIKPHTEPPKEATLTSMFAKFETYGDDKEGDILASVVLPGIAYYKQPPSPEDYFPNPSTIFRQLTVTSPVTPAALRQTQMAVCGERGGPEWGWDFSLVLLGAMSNGEQFEVVYPDLRLTNDVSCYERYLDPSYFTPAPVPTPAPTPTPTPSPSPKPPNPIPCVGGAAVTRGVIVNPEMRQCP